MSAEKLFQFLDKEHVKYVTQRHSRAYTSQEVAALSHISGWEMAKTIVIKVDDELAMYVLPANEKVNIEGLRAVLGADRLALADESDFVQSFPDCELGAMPPFGNLYGMKVYVDADLAIEPEIFFNAGTHTELVRMSYEDFERLVKPVQVEASAFC
jgi:Ala-tRNA(Pro) deacylase